MATGAKKSLGVQFFIETSVADTFIKVGELTDIPGVLGDKAGKIDVTSFDSTGYKDFISDGLKDSPEFSFKCNHVPEELGQARIFALSASGATAKFKVIFPDAITPETGVGTTIIRSGYVSTVNIVPGKTSQLVLDFTFQSSGAPTVTAAN